MSINDNLRTIVSKQTLILLGYLTLFELYQFKYQNNLFQSYIDKE